MTSSPFLSICIPTRNRAPLLRELLGSIAGQMQPDIEIVISDDGSTDETSSVADEFRPRVPHLCYERHDPPLFYDRNVLHVVHKARGEFCWLFSDDDRLEPGALSGVCRVLREDGALAGLTVDRVPYDYSLTRRLPVRALTTTENTIFTDGAEAFLALLDRVGFLSCQIIQRARWQEVVETTTNLEKYYTNYVQLYIIARVMQRTERWRFLADECVAFRADNDSFRALGSTGRLKMDVSSYEIITGDVFGRATKTYRQAMSEVATTHVRHHIVDAKRRGAPASFTWRALALCVPYYWKYPSFWMRTFPVLVAPRGFALALRRLYQRKHLRSMGGE